MFKKILTNLLSKNFPKQFSKRSNQFSTESNDVITKEINDKVIIILNRPHKLNCLSIQVLKDLAATLRSVEKKKSLVILKGTGDKAFSVGVDLIAAQNNKYSKDVILFCNLNVYLISRYKIPIVVLMDGYTMGAGAGICAFAKYRIATERTLFAMPESKIGFHCNIAATYFFNKMKGKLGYYMGLTSKSLKGSDVFWSGFATHYCLSKNLIKLEDELINCTNKDDIKNIIDDISEKNIPEFSLNPVLDNIDKCFGEPTVEKIFLKLEEDGTSWAKEVLTTLNKFSPTSLKVILRQLQTGKIMNLEEVLEMESNLTINFCSFPDVFEGIRVVLRDKNDIPEWKPSRLEDVTEEIIKKHFKPIIENQQRELFSQLGNIN